MRRRYIVRQIERADFARDGTLLHHEEEPKPIARRASERTSRRRGVVKQQSCGKRRWSQSASLNFGSEKINENALETARKDVFIGRDGIARREPPSSRYRARAIPFSQPTSRTFKPWQKTKHTELRKRRLMRRDGRGRRNSISESHPVQTCRSSPNCRSRWANSRNCTGWTSLATK